MHIKTTEDWLTNNIKLLAESNESLLHTKQELTKVKQERAWFEHQIQASRQALLLEKQIALNHLQQKISNAESKYSRLQDENILAKKEIRDLGDSLDCLHKGKEDAEHNEAARIAFEKLKYFELQIQ